MQSEDLLGVMVDPHTAENDGPLFRLSILCGLTQVFGNFSLPGEATPLVFVAAVQLLIANSHSDILGLQWSMFAAVTARRALPACRTMAIVVAVDLAISLAFDYSKEHLAASYVVAIVNAYVDLRLAAWLGWLTHRSGGVVYLLDMML